MIYVGLEDETERGEYSENKRRGQNYHFEMIDVLEVLSCAGYILSNIDVVGFVNWQGGPVFSSHSIIY